MAKFEVVSRFAGEEDLLIPQRKTAGAAGYDLIIAEDIVIPTYQEAIKPIAGNTWFYRVMTLEDIAGLTKETGAKPTLASVGVKCKLDPGTYLELSLRSSIPLKHWLLLANSVGVIDEDYYNNPDNEGEIFLQLINISPYPIVLKKGDRVGQGIIKPYLTVEGDEAAGIRTGGFGSTN